MATYITVIGIPTNVQRIELNKVVCATKAGKGTYLIFEPIYYELSIYHLFSPLHMHTTHTHQPSFPAQRVRIDTMRKNKC